MSRVEENRCREEVRRAPEDGLSGLLQFRLYIFTRHSLVMTGPLLGKVNMNFVIARHDVCFWRDAKNEKDNVHAVCYK